MSQALRYAYRSLLHVRARFAVCLCVFTGDIRLMGSAFFFRWLTRGGVKVCFRFPSSYRVVFTRARWVCCVGSFVSEERVLY